MLNELAKEVHQNAVAHGWWEEGRSFGEIIALCHSELSEALEEYRNKHKPKELYGKCVAPDFDCDVNRSCSFGRCEFYKPEGIPSKLADVIIRILDYIESLGFDYGYILKTTISKDVNNFGDFISLLHLYLSKAYEFNDISCLKGAICEIQDYCASWKIDIDEAIRIKHKYNKTRPYRHGGKVI